MECLPSDIVLDILSRLPVETVLDCKLVSKNWLNLLNHQWDEFAKMHRRRQLLQLANSDSDASSSPGLLFSSHNREKKMRFYYGEDYNNEMNIHEKLSYETFQPLMKGLNAIVGSCNGLVCLNRYHHGIHDPIHICNPNTGEYVILPEYTVRERYYQTAYGFGYVQANDQYKVVRIYYPFSDNYVYTIGSGSGWRTIGTTSYQLHTPRPLGTFVNGDLHWIDGNNVNIVAFNLADEEFRIIQPPPCYNLLHYYLYSLGALRGNLCFFNQRKEESVLDIWSLKKNATTEASWSRDFCIPYHSGYNNTGSELFLVRPLLVTKKNQVLFVYRDSTLYCYDPKANTVIKLWDVREWGLMGITAVPHMNSFVSLKALGGRSGRKRKRQSSLFDMVNQVLKPTLGQTV